jgi:hypothetical protein
VEYLNHLKVKTSFKVFRMIRISFLIGEIDIPIVERDIRGIYKMMLSPAYNDLTKLVMPKAKRNQIDSSTAITKYRVLDSNYGVSLVECQPITGRFHRCLYSKPFFSYLFRC